MKSTKEMLEIDGTSVEVSNLNKVFYPSTGFTKGEVIDYYIQVSEYLLPHLWERALTLKRYPDGVDGIYFYEKKCPSHRPDWLRTTTVPKEGGVIDYCMLNDLPSLVWASNLANLELHTFLHRAKAPRRPTALAFDLDPGEPADVIACARVALAIRDVFGALKLESFVKTSGSKGLQLYVPLNSPTTYEATKEAAHAIALGLERARPESVVSNMRKELRKGKVFVDWSQNDDHKTTVCVYSLRAKGSPMVSTPIRWREVESAVKKNNADLLRFDSTQVIKRVKAHGDLFAPVLSLKQRLPSLDAIEAEMAEIEATA